MSTNPRNLVTDHAIVRWLERVLGVAVVDKVVAEMLDEDRIAVIQKMRKGSIRIAGTDIVLCITEGRVVTVKRTHAPCRRKRRR